MLLTLNVPINGFTPLSLVATCSTPYREVYKAEFFSGHSVLMIVIAPYLMPERLRDNALREIDIAERCKSDYLLRFISRNTFEIDGNTIHYYITQPLSGARTLREAVEEKTFDTPSALLLVSELIHSLTSLITSADITELAGTCRGFYNITPDTVFFSDDEGKPVVQFTTPVYAGPACGGITPFDAAALNSCYRAPETLLGRFDRFTDVYAVGMLLHYMLTRHHPYPINETMTATEAMEIVKRSKAKIHVAPEVASIIKKAIEKNCNNRFADLNEMRQLVNSYLSRTTPPVISHHRPHDMHLPNRRNQRPEQADTELPIHCSFSVCHGEGLKGVAGMTQLKNELNLDYVEIFKNVELAKLYNLHPTNLILYGPPGTGKTFLTKRLAEECGMACCFLTPGSLASIYHHGGQQLIRDTFEEARKQAAKNTRGCLVVIDEIDALLPKRTTTNEHSAGEVAEFLTQLDRCAENRVYVIGTTNILECIDSAAIRNGRIDHVVYVGLPDAECRCEMFRMQVSNMPHEDAINYQLLADLTDGYTGSDITAIVKRAARISYDAARKTQDQAAVKINQQALESAINETMLSVPPAEAKHFEHVRDTFLRSKTSTSPTVGFSI